MPKKLYVLITVCERDIWTRTFTTLEEAQSKMRLEMMEDAGVSPNMVNDKTAEVYDDFEIGKYGGWANMRENWDWSIEVIEWPEEGGAS